MGKFFNNFFILSELIKPYQYKEEKGEQSSLGSIFEQFVEWFSDKDFSLQLLDMRFLI